MEKHISNNFFKKMKGKNCLLVLLIVLAMPGVIFGQSFTNGDLEDVLPPATLSVIPAGWLAIPNTDPACEAMLPGAATPDLTNTTDPNAATGIIGTPQSGETFVCGLKAAVPTVFHEGIMQTVSGFAIGESYSISFYQAVVKQVVFLDTAGSWIVYVDDVEIGITDVTVSYEPYNSLTFDWDLRTVSFVATETSHTIKFLPHDDDGNIFEEDGVRMGIDNISIMPCEGPTPIGNFEFVVNGLSSEDGGTGGCFESAVQFNDLSTIEDPGVITEWDWDFGDGTTSDEENPEHTYPSPGTYTVTLIVTSGGGCTATIEFDIVMTDGLILDLIFNEPTCYGFSDGSVTVNVLGGGGDLTYEITDADGNLLNEDNSNTANTLAEGWYYINVSDGSPCAGIDSVYLSQPGELDIDLDLTHPACFGFETGTAIITDVINYTGSDDMISYIWSPNPAGNSGLGEDSTWAMGDGNYTVTINDENGCSKVFDFTIIEPTEMILAEFGFEHAYCRLHEYQNGNGVVFGAAAGGTPDYSYIWTNLDNGDVSINSTWGGLNPGNYELTATDANGCVLTQALFLDSLNPIASFTVNSDQLNEDCQGTATVEVEFINTSINFANPNNPGADTTFFWNLDNPIADWQVSHDISEIFDTVYTPRGATYYVNVCLVVLNKNGCTDTACKVITIYEPIVFDPVNIFSPNGDGINDEFTFEFKSASIAEFYCIIVNRWGVVMHELNNINDGWDGTDKNGDPCTDGVYFYKYEAKADNGTEFSGQGTLQLLSGD
ncbi:MAG: gliding motility-associated-like protein [Crocinitomix sp.]